MLAPLTHRKPAWIVARGGACLRFGVRPNAFGNALGDSFVDAMRPTQGVGAYSAGDYTNEMDRASDNYSPGIDYADVESQLAEGPLYAENSAFAGRRSASTDGPWRSGYSTMDGAIQMRDLPGGHTWEERRLIELEPVTITGSRRPTPAAGLMIDPETGLASFKFTSEQLTAGGGSATLEYVAQGAAGVLFGAEGAYKPSYKAPFGEWLNPAGSIGNQILDGNARAQYAIDELQENAKWREAAAKGDITFEEAFKGYNEDRNALKDLYRENNTSPEGNEWIKNEEARRQAAGKTTKPTVEQLYKSRKLELEGKLSEVGENRAPTREEVFEHALDPANAKSNPSVNARQAASLQAAKTFAGYAEKVGMVAGVVGAAADGWSLGTQINGSIETGNWSNSGQEASRIAGGWTGAWAFGKAGAAGGAALGSLIGPAGTVVGGVVGGLVGAVGGYWAGSKAGTNLFSWGRK